MSSAQQWADANKNNLYNAATPVDPADSKSGCAQPPKVSLADLFDKASELAKQTGGNQECIKAAQNYATQHSNSGSMNASAEASALIASAKASMTASYQNSSSSQSQNNSEAGCGSLLINANNTLQQSAQLQCILNNYSQKSDQAISSSATITIRSLPLSTQQESNKADSTAAFEKMLATTLASNSQVYAQAVNVILANNSIAIEKGQAMLNALKAQQDNALATIKASQKAVLDSYSRDVTMTNTKLSLKVDSKISVAVNMTTQVKNDLKTIQDETAKDVASQAIANTMGVSAQDPSVKAAASRAVQSNASSSSSTNTGISSEVKVTIVDSSNVLIEVPGKIDMTGVTIDENIVCTLMTQAIMTQAVTSGLEAASTFLSDSKNTQGVVNQVKGLDDLQNALNAGNIGAIAAAGDVTKAGIAAFFSGDTIMYIVGGIVALGLIYWLTRPDTIDAVSNAASNIAKK